MVKYFMIFFGFVIIWMGMYFITLFWTTGTFNNTSGWFPATSHGFFLMGLAYLARISAIMSVPAKEKIIFWTIMISAIIITILGLTVWSPGPETGKIDALLLQVSAVLTAIVLIPVGLFFFNRGMKSHDEMVKTRSFLISVGMFLLLWHGISLVLVPFYGKMPWIAGEALNVLAFSTILLGILYRIPEQEPELVQNR